MEDKALERVLFQRLDKRDVHDSCLVERVLAVLSAGHTYTSQQLTTSVDTNVFTSSVKFLSHR